jgi:LuxR family maltose regulon positive regulatory protein
LGDILREWNKLAEAEYLLSQCIELVKGRLTVAREVATQASISLTRLHMARGDTNKALETLNAFAQAAREHHFLPTQLAQGAAARAQVELAQGNLAFALHWAETSGLTIEDELSYPLEREYLTLARVRLAQGRDDPADPFLPQALYLLDRLLADAESRARIGSALEVLILRALALVAQGDRASARTTLERALMLAAPEGYIRLFVDEGTPMQALLRQIHPHVHGSVQGYVSTLLSAFGGQPASPAPRPSSLVEPLTGREREVLRLLLEGASNREIARRLVLSINTVKRHIYNLCGKLGVQSRTQAIVRARTLDLL